MDGYRSIRLGYIDALDVSGYVYPAKHGANYLDSLQSRLAETATVVDRTGKPVRLTCTLGVKTSHGEITSRENFLEYLTTLNRVDGWRGFSIYTWEFFDQRFGEQFGPSSWDTLSHQSNR